MAGQTTVNLILRYGAQNEAAVRTAIQNIRSLERTISSSSRASQQARDELNRFTRGAARDAQQLSGAFGGLQRQLVALASVAGTIAIGRSIAQAAISAQSLQAALTAVTGSTENAAQAIGFVNDESQRLGINAAEATRQFTSLLAAARGTAITGDQIREVFSGVAEASAVLGLSTEQTGGALVALQQIISKGTVSSEELRGQLAERIPGAFQIAARAMGVTTAALSKMLEQGQIVSSEFIPRFATQLRQEFGQGAADAANTARAEIERLNNAIRDAAIAIAESGFLGAITDAVTDFAETLWDPATAAALQSFGQGLAVGVRSAVAAVRELKDEAILLLEILVAAKIASIATALLSVARGATLAAGAFRVLRSASGVGLALVGIEALVRLLPQLTADSQRAAQAQQELADAQRSLGQGVTLADVPTQNAEQLEGLTREQLEEYRTQQKAAIDHARAMVTISADQAQAQAEAGADVPAETFRRQVQFYQEEIAERTRNLELVRAILEEKTAAEQSAAAEQLAAERRLVENLVGVYQQQKAALEAADKALEESVERRKELAQSFAELRAQIAAGPEKPAEELTVVDPITEIQRARAALQEAERQTGAEQQKSTEDAIRRTEAAREQIRALLEAGTVSRSTLDELAQQAAAIADEAAGAMERDQRAKAQTIAAELQQTLAQLEEGAKIAPELVTEQITNDAKKLRAELEQILGKPIVVPVVTQGGAGQGAPSPATATQKKARGGAIFGPGTETSDSILAALSRGEHVLTASEVRAAGGHSAIYLLRSLIRSGRLRGMLPGFAEGGAFPDVRIPALSMPSSSSRGGDSITVAIDGREFTGSFPAGVAQELREIVTNQRLKTGF